MTYSRGKSKTLGVVSALILNTERRDWFSFDIFVETLKQIMAKYLKYTKNFYFVFTVLFIMWMVFIDSNDIISHFKLRSKLNELEKQKEFYQERKKKIKVEREELLSNFELLEKFARERYLMKRKTEDLYVIMEE